MRQVFARKNYLLLRDDGSIHYSFSKYLTDRFTNPNTRELISQSLRILYRFLCAHRIELVVRALEGRCLTDDEARKLGNLCYRPLDEIEAMGDKKVIFITSPKVGKAPKDLPNAVEPNTASKRMKHISGYLFFYRENFLDPHIHSVNARELLKWDYDKICRQLKNTIKGTKQSHHLAIKSLPTHKYLSIIEAVYVRPKELFLSASGKVSRTVLRDRAMLLLACEGLRPGTLGNIAVDDFRPNSGHLVITDHRANRRERITTNTPVLKMGDSTLVSNASATMIELWPFTVRAVQEYIFNERTAVLMKRLTNRSNGFLFLSDEGEPIKHRSSVTGMFNKLGNRLKTLGLLDVANDPYFPKKEKYDFYGYVLRHSAASFFLSEKSKEYSIEKGLPSPQHFADVPDRVKDQMKIRFGWTLNSKMPELYAARALSEQSSITLMEFNQSLLDAAQARKQSREADNGP